MKLKRGISYLAVLTTMACAGSPSRVPNTAPPPPPAAQGLHPGDAVRVEVWREEDLSGDFTVDAAGNVVLPLLGERNVTGIPVMELERNLAEEFRGFLENPSVRVTVLRRIAIFGEVRNPNLYMVDGTVTLRDALAMAGGILPTGDRNNVRLLRDGEVLIASLDLGRLIGEMPIQSGDQIEVGPQGWVTRNRNFLTAALGALTTLLAALLWSR